MDEKMKAAFDAWIKEQPSWSPEHGLGSRSFDRVIEWVLDYLRERQEPKAWLAADDQEPVSDERKKSLIAEGHFYYENYSQPLYAHPIPSAPGGCMWAVTKGGHSVCQPPGVGVQAVPEGWIKGQYGYHILFNAIAAATSAPGAGRIEISVKAFEDAMLAAAPAPDKEN